MVKSGTAPVGESLARHEAAERILMSTKIRLKRGGRKGQAYYRIVVQDSRVRPRGQELDVLGFYHPAARPEPVSEVDMQKSLDWLSKGAEMSDTARNILSKSGVLKHYHEGTRPEEVSAVIKGEMVENKGYNPPPPPVEKVVAAATEESESASPDSEGAPADVESAVSDDDAQAAAGTEEA